MGRTVYCHFAFRRPKNADYGLFAVAFYNNYDGTGKPQAQITKRRKLWADHQFITAIQSYEFALSCIYNWQGIMQVRGIDQVMLVTDNGILAGWIENPRKNKQYTDWMSKAVKFYRIGGPKELAVGVGLARVRDYEKAYKFCKEDKVVEDENGIIEDPSTKKTVIDLDALGIEYKSVDVDAIMNIDKPIIDGM